MCGVLIEMVLLFGTGINVNVLKFPTQVACLCEHSGSVVECSTRDRGDAGLTLTGFTALCP